MMANFETIIVGGGQAGLATSYYLTQRRRSHIVLEQAATAGTRSRW
jgi:putative flavoprotein involved in K+ transport